MRRGTRSGSWKRWLFALIATASLIFVGAACGDDDGDSGGGGDEGGGTVTFAALLPLTGPNAAYGEFQVNGAQMAVDEINAEGGIGGNTKIELVIEDSQAAPEETVTAFNRAYGEHEMPVAISVGSSSILALVPLAEQRKVMLLNGGSQGDELGGASDLLFSTIHLIRNEVAALAPYLVEEGGFKRAAILYIDDDLGRAGKEDFERDFAAAGGEVVASAAHEPGGTDFRSQLANLRDADPDVLFLSTYGEDAHIAVNQTRQLGWDVQLVGPSLVALPNIIRDKDAEGMITTPVQFDPPEEFVAEYEERYGGPPEHPFVGTYYDAVKVAAEAWAYAQENDLGEDGPALAEAVRQIGTFETAFGGEITFDEDGVAARPISIAVVENGKTKVVQEAE
ncbi:MAG TPA: ABC transporter substrate-binding protein [Solirubrobacterales bacterium]